LKKYGLDILEKNEYPVCEKQVEKIYHIAVGEGVLNRLPREFWEFQDFALSEIGERISNINKVSWGMQAFLDLALNPKLTIERLIQSRNRKKKETSLDVNQYVDM
jgi:hypothetical protein